MGDVVCTHVWTTYREPELRIVCELCKRVFNADDPADKQSMMDSWKSTLEGGLPVGDYTS